jgi:hypothetical protein
MKSNENSLGIYGEKSSGFSYTVQINAYAILRSATKDYVLLSKETFLGREGTVKS